MSNEPNLSTADKLQLQKKTTFSTQLAKAENDFLKVYGTKGAIRFLQEQKFADMAAKKNPKILDCSAETIYIAVSLVAMCGLTLNPIRKQCALVPRAGVCTLSIMYQGVLDLLRTDAGVICTTGVVYDCDEFTDDYKEGYGGYVNAKRKMNRPENAVRLYTYNVAHFSDGKTHCFIYDNNQVEKRRKKAQSDSVWSEWEDEMYMKTVIHAHYKYLPKSEKLDAVMEAITGELMPIKPTTPADDFDDLPEITAEEPARVVGEVTIEKKPPTNEVVAENL